MKRQGSAAEERQSVGFDLSQLHSIDLREMAIRFGFGAAIALAAGIAGIKFGPRVGGILLAFPAVLPASLTLMEKHDGDEPASISAEGAVLGGVGMLAFAAAVYFLVRSLGPLAVGLALIAWLIVSGALYFGVRDRLRSQGKIPQPGRAGGPKPPGGG